MEKLLKISWLITFIVIVLVGTFVYAHCGWGRAICSAFSIFFFACAVICYISSTKVKSETEFNQHGYAITFCLFLFLCVFIPTIIWR